MKSECQLHSPQALVPWAAGTSLMPGQAWFPGMDYHGADGAGEDVPANEPIDLPGVPAPLCRGPQPPDPGGPPAVKLRLLHLKDVGPLGWKSSRAPCLLVLGFPPPASFLGVAPPMDETTLHRVGVKATGICPGDGGRKNEWVTGLGCFSWHFPLRQSRNRTFPEALARRRGHCDRIAWLAHAQV